MASNTEAVSAKRLFKYVYRLGLIRGPYTLLRLLTPQRCVRVRLPSSEKPVFIRTGTSDVPTFEKVFITQEYDFDYYPNVRPELIIDAGANVGYASLFFARRFPHSRIIAVEPERSNFELLLRNIEPYAQIAQLQAALWPRHTRLKIENPDDQPWAFRVREAEPGEHDTVEGVTVSELLTLAGKSSVDILKVDIEGSEREVFGSNWEQWLNKVDVMVMELHDWLRAGCSTAFYRATTQFGFRQHICGENVVLLRSA